MIVTDQPELANRAGLLREYGWEKRHISTVPAWNSRLDEIQAAILRIKLPYLDQDNAARAIIAEMYGDGLSGYGMILPACRSEASHVYHLFVVRTPRRDALKQHLKERGIAALIHYPMPAHQHPAYRGRLAGRENLVETERAAPELLSLPIYPELSKTEVQAVLKAVGMFT
jgi:dTDP-4-amino-4,6-dideoxygalactose transaminase